MSIEQTRATISRAADILTNETRPLAATARGEASFAVGVFENQEDIKTNAATVLNELFIKLEGAQEDLQRLHELFDQGVEGGWTISAQADKSLNALQAVDESRKLDVDSRLRRVLKNDVHRELMSPLDQSGAEAKRNQKLMDKLGKRHVGDFGEVKQSSEDMAVDVKALLERVQNLREGVPYLGTGYGGRAVEIEAVEPHRMVEPAQDLVLDIDRAAIKLEVIGYGY
jgi:hypothetical protein